jgi:hypothetical protein
MVQLQNRVPEGLEDWAGNAAEIFTDGSFRVEGNMWERALGTARVVSSGAMVKITDHEAWQGVSIIGMQEHYSAFTLELISAALAVQCRRMVDREDTPIWTDCSSVISLLQRERALSQHPAAQLFMAVWPIQGLRKVRAHPERRARMNFWTPEEKGIYRADLIASGDQREISRFERQSASEVFRVSDTEIMEMWNEGLIFRLTLPDGSLLLADPKAMRGRRELGEYKRTRDQFRVRDGKDPKWVNMSQKIAANFVAKSPSQAQRAAACRIVWDKNWTGYNSSKGGLSSVCTLCGAAMEDQEHVIRSCSHLKMRKMRLLAKGHINKSISELRDKDPGTSLLVERYREVAYGPGGASLWVGQMTREQSLRISPDKNMTDKQWSAFLAGLLPFFEGALSMYNERKNALNDSLLAVWEKEGQEFPGQLRVRTKVELARLKEARSKKLLDARRGQQTTLDRWFPTKVGKAQE